MLNYFTEGIKLKLPPLGSPNFSVNCSVLHSIGHHVKTLKGEVAEKFLYFYKSYFTSVKTIKKFKILLHVFSLFSCVGSNARIM